MPEWVLSLLGLIGLATLWKLVKRVAFWLKRVAFWLKPQGLVGGTPLIFQIGETAYTASSPFVDEREVSAIICQVIFGNPDKRNRVITTFRLEVKSKSPYLLSEARDSERVSGSYLVPAGGGFASVPKKPWLNVPFNIGGGDGKSGWIGFCLIERRDLTLAEA